MIPTMRPILVLILSLLLLVLTACGGGADDSVEVASFGGFVEPEAHPEGPFLAGAAVATAAPAATAAPRAPVAASAPRVTGLPGPSPADEDLGGKASLVSQERLIVRNVDMRLLVGDISASLDAISDLAEELGERFVSSDHSVKHLGFIAIRVPADKLDARDTSAQGDGGRGQVRGCR